MASANFNTQIVSSINDATLEYNLDDVIIKDFDGNPGYSYGFIAEPPIGVIIEVRQGTGTYLIIPSSVQFDLSIIVYNDDKNNPIEAIASTSVNLEETPVANFNTKILSSNSNEVLSYNLDEVIDKNFSPVTGGYFYGLLDLVPVGFSIIGNTLFVPPFTNFNGLSVVVSDNGGINPVEAIAITNVTVENNTVYIAEFNTEIISSSSNEQMVLDSDIREYVLDEVIDKNFPGPYKYEFFRGDVASVDFAENDFVGIDFPKGLEIIENMEGQQVLLVGPNIEFELSIFVVNRARIEAIATTMITIDEKISFSNEITKLLNNQTLQEKFSNTKNDWAKIINRGTNEKVDDGIIYPGDDVVRPL